jgi:hypothetical protein
MIFDEGVWQNLGCQHNFFCLECNIIPSDLLTCMITIKYSYTFKMIQVLVIMSNLAKAYADSQRYDEAEALALKSIKLADETESSFKAFVLANFGLILLEEGE